MSFEFRRGDVSYKGFTNIMVSQLNLWGYKKLQMAAPPQEYEVMSMPQRDPLNHPTPSSGTE
jgi:hypothetical protein